MATGFNIAPGTSAEDLAIRRRLAATMLQQGTDASPIQSPWQGAARMAQALIGGHQIGQMREEEAAEKSAYQQQLAAILGGGQPPASAPQQPSPVSAFHPEDTEMQAALTAQGGRAAPPVTGGPDMSGLVGNRFAEPLLQALAAKKLENQIAPKDTDDIREYNLAKSQGFKGSFQDFAIGMKRAGATNVSVNTSDNAFAKALGTENAKSFIERGAAARDAVSTIQSGIEARKLLDSGIISGFGADFKVGLGKALQQAGINLAPDAVANSEAFVALRAQEVGRIIKLFGAGTGLSDADREFATKAAAGSISMNEASIRRIIDINERAARNVIAQYNKDAEKIDPRLSPFPLKIDIPEAGGGTPRKTSHGVTWSVDE